MNGKAPRSASAAMPDVSVFLSRPAYPLGSVIVGTILIRPSPSSNTTTESAAAPTMTQDDLRNALESVVVYVAGFCRIDSRWHNVADYTKIYGQVHPFLQLLYQDFDSDLLLPSAAEETVCFWATNGLELLELKERQSGAAFSEKITEVINGNATNHKHNSNDVAAPPLLAFTFRVDIPIDLPHSINATTCRYHYSADVLIRTSTKQRVIKTPFAVWTNPHEPPRIPRSQQQRNHSIVISGARVKFGTCHGMAHSNGWPCHLSATEIHRPKGQMTVALPRAREDVQTLRVSNTKGQPVCVLTVVGATKLTPGSRIHLQWDFPERISASKSWIPCHQVAACLAGEEFAIYEDGKRTTRTQSYVFDTCHEWVDPGVTHRVSKTLLLSMDAPCNLYTDIMELSVRCQIDITVKENGEYDNLRLELPCHVVHSLGEDTSRLDEDEEQQIVPLSELLGKKVNLRDEFQTNDIISDLKILALQMEERLKNAKPSK